MRPAIMKKCVEELQRVKSSGTSRRRFLQWAAGAGMASGGALLSTSARAVVERAHSAAPAAAVGDARLQIEFDAQLRSRIAHLTPWTAAESLELKDGRRIDRFALREHSRQRVEGPFGVGEQLRLIGVSDSQLEKRLEVALFERYPGFALYRVSYRNLAPQPISIGRWTNAALQLPPASTHDALGADASPPFFSYCGSTHADRRDWVQPVRPGFAQDELHGHDGLRLRRRHADRRRLAPRPWRCRRSPGADIRALVSLPVRCDAIRRRSRDDAAARARAAPGDARHPADLHRRARRRLLRVLDAYRRIMADAGLRAAPAAGLRTSLSGAHGATSAIARVRVDRGHAAQGARVGTRWAVIDDGWQSNVGDWNPEPRQVSRAATPTCGTWCRSIRAQDLKPRLWYAPLAAAPGSDLLHDHTDMLLLDKDGAAQNVSWWNSFYLCPAYAEDGRLHAWRWCGSSSASGALRD